MNGIGGTSAIGKAADYKPLFETPADHRNSINISDKIERLTQPVDTSDWHTVDISYEGYRASYTKYFVPDGQYQLHNAKLTAANRQIDAESRQILQDFYNGTADEAQLKDKFQELALKNFSANEYDSSDPDGAGTSFMLHDKSVYRVMMETFYGEFRRTALDVAVKMNNAEGQQYATGENAQPNTWEYYNSDYYYKSEEAISAATDGIKELADTWGYEEFTIPDYAKEEKWLYNNFNTAFSNPFVASEKYFKDPNQTPPEDFTWFYQEKTAPQGEIIPNSGGLSLFYVGIIGEEDLPVSEDKIPAIAWARYKDADGAIKTVNADFSYNRTKSDLYNLGSLLHFTGSSAQAKAANHFLNGLQVYRAGYFDSLPSSFMIDYRA